MKEKVFKCSVCQAEFRDREEYYRHLVQEHPSWTLEKVEDVINRHRRWAFFSGVGLAMGFLLGFGQFLVGISGKGDWVLFLINVYLVFGSIFVKISSDRIIKRTLAVLEEFRKVCGGDQDGWKRSEEPSAGTGG